MRRIGIIGAGAWGTALASVLRGAGHDVALWAREAEVAAAINRDHVNQLFLPGVALDSGIRADNDVGAVVRDAEILLLAVPAQYLRATCRALRGVAAPLVICAKGIETRTGALLSEIVAAEIPAAPAAVLSGPTFAAEVAKGLPTAVTLAARDASLGKMLAGELGTRSFRPYLADDVIGAEIGGAIKNVLAIACGVVEGRGLGRSAHAALVTRGFAELTRLAVALGGRAETVAGLCGLGDLVLTCSSLQSRNMSLGFALGRGESVEAALAGKSSVAEGLASAPAVRDLAAKLGVETPISNEVAAILAGERTVDAAIAALLARPLRAET